MDVDSGAAFAQVDLEGHSEIELQDVLDDGGVHLSIQTTSNGRIGVALTLDADEARMLGEELIAHSVLLKDD